MKLIHIRCTYCSGTVDEDEASEPKKDSRMQLAKFNLEMKPLYELLHDVESVRLAIYLLEPEPVEIEALLKNGESRNSKSKVPGEQHPDNWSGGKWANTNTGGFKADDQKVEISIGDENIETKKKTVSCIIILAHNGLFHYFSTHSLPSTSKTFFIITRMYSQPGC